MCWYPGCCNSADRLRIIRPMKTVGSSKSISTSRYGLCSANDFSRSLSACAAELASSDLRLNSLYMNSFSFPQLISRQSIISLGDTGCGNEGDSGEVGDGVETNLPFLMSAINSFSALISSISGLINLLMCGSSRDIWRIFCGLDGKACCRCSLLCDPLSKSSSGR